MNYEKSNFPEMVYKFYCLVVLVEVVALIADAQFMVRRTDRPGPETRPAKFTGECIKKCHRKLMACVAKSFGLWKHFHENKKKINRELNKCCGQAYANCAKICGSFTWG